LPSKYLAEGNTIDIFCAEIAIGYESYLNDKFKAQQEGKPPTPAKYTTDELQSMMDSVKGKKVGS